MAGHSKWANIKHRKAAQDAKRGKLWTKVLREVTVAARNGGDPADNPRLRTAMDKALAANVPKETIERAVQRGTGAGEGTNLEELTYEGYAAGGVAILIEAMTDNRNRTVAEVRHAFGKYGGNLGTDGSVAYLFDKRGVISFAPGTDESAVLDLALEAGAEDMETDDEGCITLITAPDELGRVTDALEAAALPPDHAETTMVPATLCACDAAQAESLMRLVDALEELDDVQNVFTNGEFPDQSSRH